MLVSGTKVKEACVAKGNHLPFCAFFGVAKDRMLLNATLTLVRDENPSSGELPLP